MSVLLDDIIKLASDGQKSLPDILRKCLILAHELKNNRLKEWANQELNGYKSGKDLPPYRIVPAHAYGNFVGPFHQQRNDQIIPPGCLKKEHQDCAKIAYLTQSVASYQEAIDGAPSRDRNLILQWSGNMIAYYQEKLMTDGYHLHDAWQELPLNAVVEVLDTIRNITLNMALQLKDELGTSYTDLHLIPPKEAEKVDAIIIQTTGGTTNVAFGQGTVDATGQGQTVVAVGDRKTLDRVLNAAGLGKEDLDSLTEAIEADGEKPGSKVGGWVKDKASKVLAGGVKVGTKIGAEILTAWIKAHYGI